MNPPISHWALKPVAPSPRELPLIALRPVFNIHRGRRCLQDREQPLHPLLAVKKRQQLELMCLDVGERVALSAERTAEGGPPWPPPVSFGRTTCSGAAVERPARHLHPNSFTSWCTLSLLGKCLVKMSAGFKSPRTFLTWIAPVRNFTWTHKV